MILNKVTISGNYISENGNGPGTKIQLGYRDLGTGEIEIISESETFKNNGTNNSFIEGSDNSIFTITANNVKIYEGGKQFIIIYNGKFQELFIQEENIVGLTGHILNQMIYDSKTSENQYRYEANFLKNSKTTIYDDPIINWYIIEDGFESGSKKLALSGKNESEILDYAIKMGLDHGNESRKLEIDYIQSKNIKIEELYNRLFENTDIENVLINTGYSKEQIQKIKNEGMLKNMEIYQDVTKPQWVKNVEKKLEEYRKDGGKKLEELSPYHKKQEDKKDEINIQKNNNGNENKKETILIKENNNENENLKNEGMNLIFTIGFILIFLIILLILIKKSIKKKENEEKINIIENE